MRVSAVYHLKSESYKFLAILEKLEGEISGLDVEFYNEKKLKTLADGKRNLRSIDNLQNQKIEESANKQTENFSKENLKIGNSASRLDSISDVIQK